MITLTQMDGDDYITRAFEAAKADLSRQDAPYRAGIWRRGTMWDAIAQFDQQYFMVLVRRNGSLAPAMNYYDDEHVKRMALNMGDVLECYVPDGHDACVIVRESAFIVLGEQDLYLPNPNASAHELILDIAALEAEFPNTFRIEEPTC